MEQTSRGKTRGWLGAACVLAVACGPAGRAQAQTPTPAPPASTSSKKSGVSSTPAKRQSAASHPAPRNPSAKQHAKSNSTAANRGKTTHARSATSAKNTTSKKAGGKRKTTARGQQKIEPGRAQAIQEALIREHYLEGEPLGTWDQASEDAMRRYQADHGWQSKTVPDSRALISLGLGPSHDHLLNPETAMTTGMDGSHAASVGSQSQRPESHSPDPGAINANPPSSAPAPATNSGDASGPQ